MSSKRKNRRIAKKRTLRNAAVLGLGRLSMRSSYRGYGEGLSRTAIRER